MNFNGLMIMSKYDISVVENAINVININLKTPIERVVADCMKDYLEYRKAEDQCLFIKFPCKVGDTVYVIGSLSEFGLKDEIELEVFECVVNKITLYNKYGITMQMDCKEHCSLCWSMNIRKFNELVFLNKDIAEKKLVELSKLNKD